MKRAAWVVVAFALLVGGCVAQKSAIQSTWYLAPEPSDNGNLQMYVAILNLGSETLELEQVVLNNAQGLSESGWKKEISPRKKLPPGAMLFLPVKEFHKKMADGRIVPFPPQCLVPVEVTVVTVPDDKPIRSELIGTMPSSVPLDWEKLCRQPFPESL